MLRKPLLWALPLCVSGTAFAQELFQLDEIIVTATKQETVLQDTPIAVTALSANQIANSQVDSLAKVQFLSPSVVYNTAGYSTNVYLRGIGTDITNSLAEPGTSLYVDGVYQGVTFAQEAVYNDLERIEVLRGPQGTLYGRNSTGGNINLISKKPGFDNEFSASVLLGDFERRKVSLGLQGALVDDRLAARLHLVTDKQGEGYLDNDAGNDLDKRDVKGGALSFLYTPSEDFELVLRIDRNDRDDDTPVLEFIQAVPNGSGMDLNPLLLGGQTNDAQDESNIDGDTFYRTEQGGVSLTATWLIDDIEIKSITAYRDFEQESAFDSDGTNIAFLHARDVQDSDQISQEINVSGTALNDRLDWITGLYYYDQDSSSEFFFDLPAPTPVFEQIAGVPPGSFAFIPARRLDGSGIVGPATAFLDFGATQETKSSAVFLQGTYAFTEDFRVTAGARYTRDEKDNVQSVSSNITLPTDQCFDLKLDDDWQETTWKLGADYGNSEQGLFYGSVSRGFKAGGFDIGSCNDDYDTEELTAFEIGYKRSWRTFQLSASAYYYDYEDYQARLFVANASLVENAADTTVSGAELEMLYRPSEAWTFSLGVAVSSSEFEDFMADDPLTADTALVDVEGNDILRSPDLSYNIGIQYNHTFSGGSTLSTIYELGYTDDYFIDVFNNDFAEIEDHTVQNLRVIYDVNDSWQFQAFVENLADEEYLNNLFAANTVGGTFGNLAPPRTFGVQASYVFSD